MITQTTTRQVHTQVERNLSNKKKVVSRQKINNRWVAFKWEPLDEVNTNLLTQ